jgi:hypothetical protein
MQGARSSMREHAVAIIHRAAKRWVFKRRLSLLVRNRGVGKAISFLKTQDAIVLEIRSQIDRHCTDAAQLKQNFLIPLTAFFDKWNGTPVAPCVPLSCLVYMAHPLLQVDPHGWINRDFQALQTNVDEMIERRATRRNDLAEALSHDNELHYLLPFFKTINDTAIALGPLLQHSTRVMLTITKYLLLLLLLCTEWSHRMREINCFEDEEQGLQIRQVLQQASESSAGFSLRSLTLAPIQVPCCLQIAHCLIS